MEHLFKRNIVHLQQVGCPLGFDDWKLEFSFKYQRQQADCPHCFDNCVNKQAVNMTTLDWKLLVMPTWQPQHQLPDSDDDDDDDEDNNNNNNTDWSVWFSTTKWPHVLYLDLTWGTFVFLPHTPYPPFYYNIFSVFSTLLYISRTSNIFLGFFFFDLSMHQGLD